MVSPGERCADGKPRSHLHRRILVMQRAAGLVTLSRHISVACKSNQDEIRVDLVNAQLLFTFGSFNQSLMCFIGRVVKPETYPLKARSLGCLTPFVCAFNPSAESKGTSATTTSIFDPEPSRKRERGAKWVGSLSCYRATSCY